MGKCCNFHFTFWWNPTMTLEITGIRNIVCAEKGTLGIVSEILSRLSRDYHYLFPIEIFLQKV